MRKFFDFKSPSSKSENIQEKRLGEWINTNKKIQKMELENNV